MLQRNALIAGGVILVALMIAVAVSQFGKSPIEDGEFDKGQRFTAKPGTTRENAMLLTSADRNSTKDPEPVDPDRPITPENEDDILEVRSLSGGAPKMRSGPANDVAQAALNNLSPEVGLRQLESALALPNNQEQAALLHEARAELYTRMSPPDFEQARLAFEKALEMASDPLLREEIQHEIVQMLMQAERYPEALEQAGAHLRENPPTGGAGYKLQLLLGQLYELAGHRDLAETNYRAVFDAMGGMPEGVDPEVSITLSRLATLRLTHLYRSAKRDQDAEDVALALKKRVNQVKATPAVQP
jgi:tetratricopeptide (TPR) repeat protein